MNENATKTMQETNLLDKDLPASEKTADTTNPSSPGENYQLTPSQGKAITLLKRWFEGEEKEAALIGPAGTGKTFVLKRLLKEMDIDGEIMVLASTHKARKIVSKAMGISASTVAQALGQQPVINEKGQEVFVTGRISEAEEVALVLVDEASMVNKENYFSLKRLGKKILWIGDKYQLPPVKESKSQAFSSPSVTHQAELTEIVRYQGAIADFCAALREGDCTLPEGDNDTLIVLPKHQWFAEALAHAKRNPDNSKVIAFRNKTVDLHNHALKSCVYPEETRPYFEGLRLICNAPIQRLELKATPWEGAGANQVLWTMKATNSEELVITSTPELTSLNREDFENGYESLWFQQRVAGWKLWKFQVKTEGGLQVKCRVLTPKFQELREAFIEELYKDYKRLNQEEIDALKCFYRWFDKVADTFAITTHKSQGSTYENVFVNWNDLITARSLKKQLLYTACTRASKKLFIGI